MSGFMSTAGIPDELHEKNEQEFVKMTDHIQLALVQIENDLKLKATQDVLARLSGCSRGTLNNRKWPLERLMEIKAARKAASKPLISQSGAAAKVESEVDRYKQQLEASRDEVRLWKTRHDSVKSQLDQTKNLNSVLQTRLTAIELELASVLRDESRKVVTLRARTPKR